jgi:hypothetical protein
LNRSDSESSLKTLDTSTELANETPYDPENVNCREYGASIIECLKKTEQDNSGGLDHHEIKGRHRKQMAEWMRDVLEVFKSPIETFFSAVTIMDRYYNEQKRCLQIDELHEIGVTSILIASKFTEIEPLTVDLMHRKASHGKVTQREIIERERDILNTLKFEVAIPTILDCSENLLSMLSMKYPLVKENKDEIKKHSLALMKEAVLNYRFCFEMKPTQLALVILKMSIKMCE